VSANSTYSTDQSQTAAPAMSQMQEIERQNEKLKQVLIAHFQPSASLYSDCLKSYVTCHLLCPYLYWVTLTFAKT